MLDAIVGAIIGGVLGLFAGAGNDFLKTRGERKSRYKSERLPAIPGYWKGGGGDTYVEGDRPPLAFDLTLAFRVSGTRITGTGALEFSPSGNQIAKTEVECDGGFLNGDYMQFTYRSKDRSRKQIGVIVFRLTGDSTVLVGHYAGLSPSREVFVVGEVSLKKLASLPS